MTQAEALRLALEALEGVLDDSPKVLEASISGGLYEVVQCRDAIIAIKEALAQSVPHAVIAGALFDFMGWLTSRKERLVLSSADEASPAVDAIRDFAKMRGLSLDDAKVQDWNNTSPAALTQADERNKLASWMMARGYATGHGDSIEDLLQELDWQIAENWTRGMVNGVEAERAACAKLCDELQDYPTVEARHCAEEIRARGQA